MSSGSPSIWICYGAGLHPGFDPVDPLVHPSAYQQKKNAKHGISSGSPTGAWSSSSGSYPGHSHATEFFREVNLAALANDVWTVGFILRPTESWKSPSLFITTGSPLGGRLSSGSPTVYYGFRAARPDSLTELHYFADSIDPNRDGQAECPICHSLYPASSIPHFCRCGRQLSTW